MDGRIIYFAVSDHYRAYCNYRRKALRRLPATGREKLLFRTVFSIGLSFGAAPGDLASPEGKTCKVYCIGQLLEGVAVASFIFGMLFSFPYSLYIRCR